MAPRHRIYTSSYIPPDVPTNLSVCQLLLRYNPDDVDNSKVICEDEAGRTLTYAGITEVSAKGAFGLAQVTSMEEGDIVCICAPNSVDVIRLIHAVLWRGGTAVLINPLSTEYEVKHCLNISQPQILAADASTWPTLFSAARSRRDFPELKLISIDGADCPTRNAISLSTLFDQSESLPPLDLSSRDSRDHTAVVCFSSGTSGSAKGVELSHYNLVASMLGIRSTEPSFWNASIRGVFFAPLCHIYGLMTVALMGCWIGFYTFLAQSFELQNFLERSEKIGANAMRILPTIAVTMGKQTTFDLARLGNVRYIMCSGAVLPSPVISFLRTSLPNTHILQGYGMTETNITTLRPESAHRIGSVGKLFANIEARIVNDSGHDVDEGEQGEILVRGPSVFRRYMRNEVATEETFDGEWMKTGDVARVDTEGYWYLTERKKELIKYKGNQVPPAELEAHLNAHPAVREAAVCALWDEEQGTEVPIAYISLTPEARAGTLDEGELVKNIREHVDEKVAGYKKLRGGVVVLDEIPKSGNGKVLRRLLPARLARERKGRL